MERTRLLQQTRRLVLSTRATRVGLAASLVYVGAGLPCAGAAVALAAVLLLRLVALRVEAMRFIDQQLARQLGLKALSAWSVHTKVYPRYRLVDIRQAVEAPADGQVVAGCPAAAWRPSSQQRATQHTHAARNSKLETRNSNCLTAGPPCGYTGASSLFCLCSMSWVRE